MDEARLAPLLYRRLLPGLFALVALSIGLALALLTPPFQNPDEGGHFLRATQIAGGEFVGRRLDGGTSGGRGDSPAYDAALLFAPLAGPSQRRGQPPPGAPPAADPRRAPPPPARRPPNHPRLRGALAIGLIAAGRPAYAPLVLLPLLGRAGPSMRIAGVALGALCLVAWAPFAAGARIEFVHDGVQADSAAQLATLLAHPLAVPTIALQTLRAHAVEYAIMFVGALGSLDVLMPKLYYAPAGAGPAGGPTARSKGTPPGAPA